MVEIERPKSIFGKVPYGVEQRQLIDTVVDVTKGIGLINPILVGYPEIFAKFKTEKERIEKADMYFKKAKERLESIGV